MEKKYGKGMVLGAAEGLGASFAEILATRCDELWMIDHNRDALQRLASKLEEERGAIIHTLCMDLAVKEETALLDEIFQAQGIDLLVYVAAHSRVEPFLDLTEDDLERTLLVNTATLSRVCQVYGASCRKANRKGGLILVSSLAGWFGLPAVSLYGATKAFIWNLAEGLQTEWKPYGIDVLGLVCGAMDTPGLRHSQARLDGLPVEQTETVAKEALRQLGRRSLWVAGLKSRLGFRLLHDILPRKMARRLMIRQLEKMYPDKLR